jgi:hypothetical protein
MAPQPQTLGPEHPLSGIEPLKLGDFWAWAYSDVLANTTRAVFAEFLIGVALGVIHKPRVEWDASDLTYRGRRIEVKSSAYRQTWSQPKLSRIVFDIARKKAWYAHTNESSAQPVRAADLYVFCLLREKDPERCNPLDVAGWEFYVVSRTTIDARFGDQKSIGLSGIQALVCPARHDQIRGLVDGLVSELDGMPM